MYSKNYIIQKNEMCGRQKIDRVLIQAIQIEFHQKSTLK